MQIRPHHFVLGCAALFSSHGQAAVTAEEAAKLRGELTPLGAQRQGNKEGTIPAWTGAPTVIAGDKAGGRRGDPFKDEKPLYSVTARNMAQHADKLTDGTKALLTKYPDSFRLDVYKTYRTAIAPQWVYDNTAKNATQARLEKDVPVGAYGGIPFPIPKTGGEAIWNHLLRWRGVSWESQVNQYQITANGKVVLTSDATMKQNMPYYFEDGSLDTYRGFYWDINLVNAGPPIRAGEMLVGRESFDTSKTSTYIYLTGQRRVRKLPNACCDSPTPASAGVMSFDELQVWSGRTDRFDWKVLGKKEILVPYNSNRFLQAKESDLVTGQHLNPDHVRWELHRVWVVEAKLRAGERHLAPRSVYYLDVDTWAAVLGDRWDAQNQLWKSLWTMSYVMPDLPGTVQQTFGYYDLLSGLGYVANVLNEKAFHQRFTKRWPDEMFTGDGLASRGVR